MSAMNEGAVLQPVIEKAGVQARRRAAWLHQVTLWHWVSSALSLVGMLFFAVSGITLNHAELFERASASVTHREASLPPAVMQSIKAVQDGHATTLPLELQDWLRRDWHLVVHPKGIEWSEDEVFVDLKRPGVDVSLRIDRHTGVIAYEEIDRGWVAWFNELHRGRNAGVVWTGFITTFGVVCVVFCVTGFLILQAHARSRWQVWPITGLGFVLPVLLILLFIH